MPSPTEPADFDVAGATDAYDRIKASGLFDPLFYRATYGDVPTDQDPLRHFLDVGLAAGYLPRADFDPVLYRLTMTDCGLGNPLLHFLDHRDGVAVPQLEEACRALIGRLSKKPADAMRAREPDPARLRAHLDYTDNVAQARTTSVEIGGATYRIEVPPADFFAERLRGDKPFAFARLTHGFWDALSLRNQIADDPQLMPLTPAERRALASRIALAAQRHVGAFMENFFDEVLAMIPCYRGHPGFFNSVAFKGFPRPDEDLFNPNVQQEQRDDRLALLAQTFAPEDRLLDANLWKRLAFAGDLARLPALCRTRPVVLIASDYFRDLDRRWGLPRFTHVQIPRQLSHSIRWHLLGQLQVALEEKSRQSGPRPVLLLQCSSLAYWLTARLFAWNPDVFYIDLGQALNIWFTDVPDMPFFEWMHFYRAAAAKRGAAL